MGSAPPQPQDGEGKSSAPGAHPCLPREGSAVWNSQAEDPREATFIISAFESHLQYVFSVLLQSNTPQCNSVLWEVGQSQFGSWFHVRYILVPPESIKIGNQILAKTGFSLMSSHYVLHTLQQGASPMPSDTYKVFLINWHLP